MWECDVVYVPGENKGLVFVLGAAEIHKFTLVFPAFAFSDSPVLTKKPSEFSHAITL